MEEKVLEGDKVAVRRTDYLYRFWSPVSGVSNQPDSDSS